VRTALDRGRFLPDRTGAHESLHERRRGHARRWRAECRDPQRKSSRNLQYASSRCRLGCGIPASVKDRIYDPFFTTKKTQRLAFRRLCVLKPTARYLRVDSEVDSHLFHHPLSPQREEERKILVRETTLTLVPRHETILVVDDEEAIRLVTETC
jgi:hypothetical protein